MLALFSFAAIGRGMRRTMSSINTPGGTNLRSVTRNSIGVRVPPLEFTVLIHCFPNRDLFPFSIYSDYCMRIVCEFILVEHRRFFSASHSVRSTRCHRQLPKR